MFKNESDLVESFTHKHNSFLRVLYGKAPRRSFLIKEFDSQFGVADIVLGTFLKHKRLSVRNSTIKGNWFVPLHMMKVGDTFTLQDFSAKFGYSTGYSREILKLYQEEGYLQAMNKEFKIVKSYEVILRDTIAIEAKLKNWKRALSQAKRYKRFADLSFVLLDQRHVSAALKNIGAFEASNIGLISLGNNQITYHYLPQKMDKKITPQLVELNESAKSPKAKLISL